MRPERSLSSRLPSLRTYLWSCTAAALSVFAVACGNPTGISMELTVITPDVTALNAWVAGNMLVVQLTLGDPSISLSDADRIPIAVQSASNDAERVLARPLICEDSEYGKVVCGQVFIGTDPGDLGTVARRLREFGAFIFSQLGGGTSVVAHFPYGALEDILATVGRWPETRWVEPHGVLVSGAQENSVPVSLEIRGFMAIENTAVTPGNDFLEAAPGDVLHVEYVSPGRPPLVKEVTFQ
ncbi:MAG: hypothetical protein IIA55_10755 [Gemmatimonadetes bacterium]|nr:hypothetical protein [Gemmatimonadota bacterium]